MSDSLQPHGLKPMVILLCPWNSPGKNTGLGCHFLLQGIFPSQGSNLRLLMSPALAEGIFTPSAGSKTSPLHTQESVPVQGPALLQAVPQQASWQVGKRVVVDAPFPSGQAHSLSCALHHCLILTAGPLHLLIPVPGMLFPTF